jgi:phage terminase large subunit
MAQIQLNLKKSMFVPKFYTLLTDYSHRWEFWVGSAGSGKSYTIAQKIIIRCCREPIRVVVCRRYGTTLRNTCFSLFKEILAKWKLTPYVKMRETDMNIKFPNGSEIIMLGLDEETKLLSLNNISTIWVEEAYEVPQPIVEQLNIRMRGQAANQQLLLSWNPISKNSWLYNFTVENPPDNSIYIHSTYKDNPFLNDEYIAALDEMAERNPAKYKVYGLGLWGVDVEGLVFQGNWREEDFDPLQLASFGYEHRAGCDLGWVDPSVAIDTLYDRENKTIYVFNEFYKSGCQLEELANAIKDMGLTKTKLYVDASEPRTIQYFRQQGINAAPCAKGKDSVKTGYQFLQDHLILVHPKCQKLIMELSNFSYIKSKQTGLWTEDTTHEWSHAIDALRYGYADIYTQTKAKALNLNGLGL